MDRRFILALSLSMLVLISWSTFMSKSQHINNKEVTALSSPAVTAPLISPPLQLSLETPLSALWKFSHGRFDIVFAEPQASMQEVVFKDYQNYVWSLQRGLLLWNKGMVFQRDNSASDVVSFTYQSSDLAINKRYTFSKSDYTIDLEVEWKNMSNLPYTINPALILGTLNFDAKNPQSRFQGVTVACKDKILHLDGRKEGVFADTKFLALQERYFCAIIEPDMDNYSSFIRKTNNQTYDIGMSAENIVLAPGQSLQHKFRIYLGPQDLTTINRIKPAWSVIMYYGTFNLIAHLLLQFLQLLFNLVHNWGVAIIVLSIAIYFLLYPLTMKQMRAAREMQILQPKIEEVRKLYKDNPQKLNKEIMELYRNHKVNPLGGCLPLILQIPVFFALYQALMRSVFLKGARFLWIKDLSQPDRLFTLPTALPIIGKDINILPLLMMAGMFVQQKTTVMPGSGSTAEQQKIMLIIFPLMFGFIFYSMPSGLVLYWFINSLFMLAFQLRYKKAAYVSDKH